MKDIMNCSEIHNYIVGHFNEWEQSLRKSLEDDPRRNSDRELFTVVSESIDNAIGNVQNMLDTHSDRDITFMNVTDFAIVIGDTEDFFLSRILLRMSIGYTPISKIPISGESFKVLFVK